MRTLWLLLVCSTLAACDSGEDGTGWPDAKYENHIQVYTKTDAKNATERYHEYEVYDLDVSNNRLLVRAGPTSECGGSSAVLALFTYEGSIYDVPEDINISNEVDGNLATVFVQIPNPNNTECVAASSQNYFIFSKAEGSSYEGRFAAEYRSSSGPLGSARARFKFDLSTVKTIPNKPTIR